MSKVLQIAAREFVATVFTKAFVIGLLILPVMIGVFAVFGARLFGPDRNFAIAGQLAVVDPTDKVVPELRAALAKGTPAADLADAIRVARGEAAGGQLLEALGIAPKLTLVERPANGDLEQEKAWLRVADKDSPHLGLAVIHANAVEPKQGDKGFGSYDLYVPPKQDTRVEIGVQQAVREAIIGARLKARGLDRAEVNDLTTIPRVRSVAVTADNAEQGTLGGLEFLLPLAFMFLLFMGVMGSGQGLLTTTIEEKSSRVIEVILSAVSPMQLMAGKLLGHMAISLLAMSLYVAMGLAVLTSFSLFGLLNFALIPYLLVFFVLAFFTVGSLMMAVGSAVNDLREAQSLMTPMMLLLMTPWFLWFPISRNPESTLAVVVSFLPPVNSFGMMLRLASPHPPPAWQIWLSVAVGAAGVVGAVWFASKVFRIGLLMFGKPPDFATLVRWVRAA